MSDCYVGERKQGCIRFFFVKQNYAGIVGSWQNTLVNFGFLGGYRIRVNLCEVNDNKISY